MKRTLGAFVLLSLMMPIVAQAQETPRVGPGDRVRVTAPECELRKSIGTLVALDDHHLSAMVGTTEIECPVEALINFEVSEGRRHWWKAGFVGAGIVAVTGTLLAAAADSPEGEAAGYLGLSTIILTPVGFMMGSLVGLIRGTDSWKEVPLPSAQPFFFVSGEGRLSLGIAIPLRR